MPRTTEQVCTRRIQWCMGHRLVDHEGKCAHLHGHNYVAHIVARGALDAVGRVVDFAVLKDAVGGWIEENWDHGFLLNEADPLLPLWRNDILGMFVGSPQKYATLPVNPTAENIANHLLTVVCPSVLMASEGVEVVEVTVEETENCSATATLVETPWTLSQPQTFTFDFDTTFDLLGNLP